MDKRYESWGRFPQREQKASQIIWRNERIAPGQLYLPRGNGRSYGDSCLSESGVLLDARGLDRLIKFDSENAILRCEAGTLISDILEYLMPKGFCLPVVPGTQMITVGGAIANDVHGKNHPTRGTFGNNVVQFELLRSDGTRRQCSLTDNRELFEATIGGLGLTGLITWAELKIMPVVNQFMSVETVPFGSITELYGLLQELPSDYEYKAAWIDCLASGSSLGRGILSLATHNCQQDYRKNLSVTKKWMELMPKLSVPGVPPVSIVNTWSVKWFNYLYFHKAKKQVLVEKFTDFMFPLDGIYHWNYLYGKKGFLQYQCVVPYGDHEKSIKRILEKVSSTKISSCLTVLKLFGDSKSPGILSFPRPGITLAMDFPIVANKTSLLLDALDEIVIESGGAVYPAKDARMSADAFKKYFPRWQQMEKHRDPNVSSAFWDRVSG